MESLGEEKNIRVLYVKYERLWEGDINISDITVENKLDIFREMVGGKYLIAIPLDNLFCVVNADKNYFEPDDEFIFDSEVNFILREGKEEAFSLIKGDVFFVGNGGEEFRSLTNEEADDALVLAGKGKMYLEAYERFVLNGDNE